MAHKPTYRKASFKEQPQVAFGSRTDIGIVRKDNEDSLIAAAPLFAVADGMGGHAAGEVASEIAISVLAEHAPPYADAEALGQAVVEANRAVMQAAQERRNRKGMGTTLTAAILEGERLIIAHVGDSRAYLFHQGKLQQITRDHSLMADMIEAGQLTSLEARYHPKRSVITRALGSDPRMLADIYEINVKAGDRLLLCTDGLSSMVVDEEIGEMLAQETDPQRCADKLVDEAIAAGGNDNITVVVVEIPGFSEIRQKKYARKTTALIVCVVIALLAIIAAAIGGFYYYTQNSYYLTDEDGKVAVYQGIPGSLFGFRASQLDYVTDVETKDLDPGLANRLQEGIRVDDLEDAKKHIDEYRKDADRATTPGSDPPDDASSEGASLDGASLGGASLSLGSASA